MFFVWDILLPLEQFCEFCEFMLNNVKWQGRITHLPKYQTFLADMCWMMLAKNSFEQD